MSLIKPLLLALSAVLLSLNFINVDINEKLPYDHKENFNPGLSYLNSIDRLETYIDSTEKANQLAPNTVGYIETIDNAIKNRFFHGFSHFTIKENWIAAFSERVVGYGLDCKVRPDDIMKNENAACSQQSMVMMEILKRKKITYRSVGFPHHFAMEVQVQGKWYYFDPNMEPKISNQQRLEENWGGCADNLKRYYDTSRFKDLDWKFGKQCQVTFGTINDTPAGHAKMFQSATAFFSRFLWCFPLLIVLYKSRSTVKVNLKKLWLFLTNNQKQLHWNQPYKANSLT
jgi:hypothetical protein